MCVCVCVCVCMFSREARLSNELRKIKNLPAMQETQVRSLCWEDPLEKGMATHSSILAWRILWTEEPGGLQSVRPQRVRRDWAHTGATSFHALEGSKNRANQEATSSRCDVKTCQTFPGEVSALPSPGVQAAGLTMGRDRIVTFILRTMGNHQWFFKQRNMFSLSFNITLAAD